VLGADVRDGRVLAFEALDQHVRVLVVDAAGPLEELVARLGAGAAREVPDDVQPGVRVLGFHRPLDHDENHALNRKSETYV
jgi:hypothetical protein